MERSGKPTKGVTLSAPRDGVVLARDAIDGMYVEPSTELFVISDLSKLWIVFDVFEGDMPFVKLGQSATFRCEGLPHAHDATVSFIAPAIDPSTRSLRARVEVDNQDGLLRPGAFSTVELSIDLGTSLAVPEDAVLRTGAHDLVFVVSEGMAVPTHVELGPRAGDVFPVTAGLAEGDVVVTGAQFLIDSESRLRGSSAGGNAHAGH
jgi:Cu(I)/Ag(I) efflux system membrane fusion protein